MSLIHVTQTHSEIQLAPSIQRQSSAFIDNKLHIDLTAGMGGWGNGPRCWTDYWVAFLCKEMIEFLLFFCTCAGGLVASFRLQQRRHLTHKSCFRVWIIFGDVLWKSSELPGKISVLVYCIFRKWFHVNIFYLHVLLSYLQLFLYFGVFLKTYYM